LGPHTPFVLSIISFIIVFVVILVIVQLISLRFEKLSDYLHLGLANQILGALFGLLKWAFLLSLFIYVFNLLNHHFLFQKGDKYYNSWLYEHISQIVPMLLPKLSK